MMCVVEYKVVLWSTRFSLPATSRSTTSTTEIPTHFFVSLLAPALLLYAICAPFPSYLPLNQISLRPLLGHTNLMSGFIVVTRSRYNAKASRKQHYPQIQWTRIGQRVTRNVKGLSPSQGFLY